MRLRPRCFILPFQDRLVVVHLGIALWSRPLCFFSFTCVSLIPGTLFLSLFGTPSRYFWMLRFLWYSHCIGLLGDVCQALFMMSRLFRSLLLPSPSYNLTYTSRWSSFVCVRLFLYFVRFPLAVSFEGSECTTHHQLLGRTELSSLPHNPIKYSLSASQTPKFQQNNRTVDTDPDNPNPKR